ncbi:hypothetical protein [Spiroplasma endosymbiont of Ammophila pubescens]
MWLLYERNPFTFKIIGLLFSILLEISFSKLLSSLDLVPKPGRKVWNWA